MSSSVTKGTVVSSDRLRRLGCGGAGLLFLGSSALSPELSLSRGATVPCLVGAARVACGGDVSAGT